MYKGQGVEITFCVADYPVLVQSWSAFLCVRDTLGTSWTALTGAMPLRRGFCADGLWDHTPRFSPLEVDHEARHCGEMPEQQKPAQKLQKHQQPQIGPQPETQHQQPPSAAWMPQNSRKIGDESLTPDSSPWMVELSDFTTSGLWHCTPTPTTTQSASHPFFTDPWQGIRIPPPPATRRSSGLTSAELWQMASNSTSRRPSQSTGVDHLKFTPPLSVEKCCRSQQRCQ